MAKKKQKKPVKKTDFDNNPFKSLKGFAVSEDKEEVPEKPEAVEAPAPERSFDAEMDFLGVTPLDDRDESVVPEAKTPPDRTVAPPEPESDEEVFLDALGELDVRFSDQLPDEPVLAQPRRMKQLRQGRLTPEASLDLHGFQRHEVSGKLTHFLQNASRNGWQTLLVVTGRGLHSDAGVPVLRDEVERFLHEEGKTQVAEWGRAPRQYGGDGALVLFMKKQQSGER